MAAFTNRELLLQFVCNWYTQTGAVITVPRTELYLCNCIHHLTKVKTRTNFVLYQATIAQCHVKTSYHLQQYHQINATNKVLV